MESIINDFKNCELCDLHRFRGRQGYENICFWRGEERAEIYLLGEAPGENEAKQGKPFVGKAGQLLDKIITSVNHLDMKDIHINNCLLCRPSNNATPTKKQIIACMPRLTQQINLVRPKIVIALGNVALNTLSGKTGITKMRGIVGWSGDVLSGQFKTRWIRANGEAPYDFLVGATFHPAAAFRGSEERRANVIAAIKTDLQIFANRIKLDA